MLDGLVGAAVLCAAGKVVFGMVRAWGISAGDDVGSVR